MLPANLLPASALLIGYTVFCVLVWCQHRRTRTGVSEALVSDLLVAYASQGGAAERIARASAAGLGADGAVRLLPLNRVDEQVLRTSRRALFVVSTYGEGEPPDNGALFARRYLKANKTLQLDLDYGVLALGDRQYPHFCAFGEQLHQGLARAGARPLFDTLKMDRECPEALQSWHSALGQLSSTPVTFSPGLSSANDESAFGAWQLLDRCCLNPGSAGAPVYQLRLCPLDATARAATWCAGDIAQVLPGAGVERWREYSIASVPEEGILLLVVRLHRHSDGTLGLGSGWLTQSLKPGEPVQLRIRSNPGFHPVAVSTPAIFIGNGTGIAGLRAHLMQRVQAGARDNWLLFGERNQAHDALYDDQLQQWLALGQLQRLTRTFSRDPEAEQGLRYVQHALALAGDELRDWVARGACMYVCGSLRGMATDVDQVLRAQLGEACVDQLLLEQRYRRDVY